MPRTKEQFEAMRLATSEKILAAAGELFAKKGLAGTNVQEIADLAGISIGLLYRHYKTKEELFDALVSEASDGLAEVAKLFLSDAPPVKIIENFCKEVVTDVEKNDDFNNSIMLITQAITSGNQSAALQTLLMRDKEMFDALKKLVERGQSERVCRPGNPYDLALLFCSMLQGISQFKLVLKEEYKAPAPESLSSILLV